MNKNKENSLISPFIIRKKSWKLFLLLLKIIMLIKEINCLNLKVLYYSPLSQILYIELKDLLLKTS